MANRIGFWVVLVCVVLASGVAAQDDRLLVWTAPGASPSAASAVGELAYLVADDGLTPLLPVPARATRIEACGQGALAPNGEHFALVMGDANSRQGMGLYLLHGDAAPLKIDDIHVLGCWGGNGQFGYAPDSRRLAYIAYEPDATVSTFAEGALKVRQTNAEYDLLLAEDDVTAFDHSAAGVVFVRFLRNRFNNADQALLFVWDGQQTRELVSLAAGADCQFVGASVESGEGHYWLALGERCGGARQWNLYRINQDGSNGLLAIQAQPRGNLPPSAAVDMLLFAQDHLFYTLPSGLALNKAGVYRVPLDDLPTSQTLIPEEAIMPIASAAHTIYPQLSPDGKWWLVVTQTRLNEWALLVFDLQNPANAPISIPSGQDAVLFAAFTPNSQSVIFISGVAGDMNNQILRYDLAAGGAVAQVRRGGFTQWARIAEDALAVLTWQQDDSLPRNFRRYTDLLLVPLDGDEPRTLYSGLQGEPDAYQLTFAMPLR